MPTFPALTDAIVVRSIAVAAAVGFLAFLDLMGRLQKRDYHLLFSCFLGSVLSLGIIEAGQVLLSPEVFASSTIAAISVLFIISAWVFLFGPWDPPVKATVLGTFIFWISIEFMLEETLGQFAAHLVAAIIAIVPALIWGALFLEYHRERLSLVFLMFFAGMLSTVPILFYDQLVRHGVELDLFYLRIVPQGFHQAAKEFVMSVSPNFSTLIVSVMALGLSSCLVGFLEEASKYWVLRRSGQTFFTSIDDVLQLAIIAAIGFAFAENVTPFGYFVGFVREYLLNFEGKDWLGFVGNIVGRGVLTNMVHIFATGISGFFLGRAIFAVPFLQDAETRGKRFWLVEGLHHLFGFQKKDVYRIQMLFLGVMSATVLHGFSNFLVTLPDVLPGNPRTIGDLFGLGEGSPLNYVSLLLVPWFLYVIGGFWVLTILFFRKENMKERGVLVTTDTFVKRGEAH